MANNLSPYLLFEMEMLGMVLESIVRFLILCIGRLPGSHVWNLMFGVPNDGRCLLLGIAFTLGVAE